MIAVLLLTQDRQPFAEAAVKAAEASPRVLIDGWQVTRVDEWQAGTGEMTFEREGRTLELRWPPDGKDKFEQVKGSLYRYAGVDDFVLLLNDVQIRGKRADLEAASGELERVGVQEWLKALPANAVAPTAQTATIDGMLKGMPLPPGFKAPAATGETRDRYQLGAKVAGAVACGWIERYLAGDPRAAAALATSREWPLLRQMDAEGDYPEAVWQYADAVNGASTVPGGKPGLTIGGTYKDALGC